MPVLPGEEGKARLQELVGDGLVATEPVFKMLNALSSMRDESYGSRRIGAGRGRQGGGNTVATAVSIQDRFAALTRGIEVAGLEGAGCDERKTRASSFVQAFGALQTSSVRMWLPSEVSSRGGLVRRRHFKFRCHQREFSKNDKIYWRRSGNAQRVLSERPSPSGTV